MRSTSRRLSWLLPLFGLCAAAYIVGAPVAAQNPVVLGLSAGEADRHDVEFQRYGRMIPVYKENGIQASLVEYLSLLTPGWSEERIYNLLKTHHVVRLHTGNEGVYQVTPQLAAQARTAGAALLRYVQDGGGLLLQPEPVRYPNSEDEKYWNLVLAPLGVQILHEGIYDTTRNFEGGAVGRIRFWVTRNIAAHPTTEGVQTLCLPQSFMGPLPGTVAMQYGPEWRVVVRGEKEAKSYRSGTDNANSYDKPGTYPEAPPVLAVRELGKGRVACLPVATVYTADNYLNPVWDNTFETAGDRANGTLSDGLKLMMNCYRWLAQPAQADPAFGTHQIAPYQPVQFPATVNWDGAGFAAPATSEVRGIFGLHSAYSDGQGTVAEFAAAAQAAKLGFIVFTDPLEQLSADELAKLKADCTAASEQGVFYACPGIEFTDGIGNRWVIWGGKVVWPEATFQDKTWTYTQWDGQRVHFYGKYMDQCGFPGSALLDYKQLRANGAHAENLWWFYHTVGYSYDRGKLFADNTPDYLFAQRDLRMLAPVSYTRLLTPGEVAGAAGQCWTGFRNVVQAQENLNTRCSQPFWSAAASGQYISQGPQITAFDVMNNQMESHPFFTRGAQRVRVRFAVHSDTGLAEVRVHDADLGPIRRYLAAGAADLQREFELVHDKQHNLVLEVIDTKGRRAWSTMLRVYSYKQGFMRCGDNLNILSASMCWIPDRNGMVSMGKSFNNGADYSLRGADSSGPVCPTPQAWGEEQVHLKGVGAYPKDEVVSKLMDVQLGSYQLQIASQIMEKRSETWDCAARPGPAIATVPKDLGDLEYFTRIHTLYAPADRADFYIAGNYRRLREGTKDYRGALNWHEGEIRFKRDVVLQGAVPIPLVQMRCPVDIARQWGTTLLATDTQGTRVAMQRDAKKPQGLTGRLRPGGYLAMMPTLLGYEAFLAPEGSDFAYEAGMVWEGSMGGRAIIGLGHEGQEIKAGTVLKYRFAFGEFADPVAGNIMLEDTVRAFNLGGGQAGYPIQMKVGEIADAVYFFTARAQGQEALFTLGPRATMLDLPVRVRGLQDNGCAALYSTKRPWFRFISVVGDTAYFQEPIEQANEMWVGNVFLADNPVVKLTLVVEGQAPGAQPFLEVHNPTDKEVTVTVRSPEHTPVFAGTTGKVTVPAGDSVRVTIEGKGLVPK